MGLILFLVAPIIIILTLWLCRIFNISMIPLEYKTHTQTSKYEIPEIDARYFKWASD